MSISLRNGRDAQNVIWSAIDFSVVPIGMLIATPFLVNALGIAQFGVLVLANTLVGFGALFNFGFGETALKYVARYHKSDEKENAAKVTQTVGFLVVSAGVLVAALFAGVAPAASSWLGLDGISNAQSVLFVTALLMPLRMTESVYASTLRGCYRYDLAGVTTVTTKLSSILLQVTIAVLGYPVESILLGTACIVAISNVALFAWCWMQLGNVLPWCSLVVLKEIRGFALWSWLQGLAGLVYANVDKIVVTSILGPAALGIYGVCIQLAQNIHNGVSALSHIVFPRVSFLKGARSTAADGESDELQSIYIKASRYVTILAVTVSSIIAVFSFQVLEIWVGETIATEGEYVLSLLVLSFCWFTANHTVSYYTLNGLGLARFQAIVSLAGATVMTMVCVLSVPTLGLFGAAAARFADLPVRLGVRMYVSRSIVGGVSVFRSFDFLRVTAVVGVTSFLLKELLVNWWGIESVFWQPMGIVAVLLYMGVALLIVNYIEVFVQRFGF